MLITSPHSTSVCFVHFTSIYCISLHSISENLSLHFRLFTSLVSASLLSTVLEDRYKILINSRKKILGMKILDPRFWENITHRFWKSPLIQFEHHHYHHHHYHAIISLCFLLDEHNIMEHISIAIISQHYNKNLNRNLLKGNCNIYRVSQEECARLRESVLYVKLYRYNPKLLYPKLNVYGDNGQRGLKLWQRLLTYWLPNTYWNWQEYVVSVMLIVVRNMKVICEKHKEIKLNYKNTRNCVIVVFRLPSTLRRPQLICYLVTSEPPCADCSVQKNHLFRVTLRYN